MSDFQNLPLELFQEILLLAAPACCITSGHAAARRAGTSVRLNRSERISLRRLRQFCSFSELARASLPAIERLWLKNPAMNVIEFTEFCRTATPEMTSIAVTICPDEFALQPPAELQTYCTFLTVANLQAVPTEWFTGTLTRNTLRFWWALRDWWRTAIFALPEWIRYIAVSGTIWRPPRSLLSDLSTHFNSVVRARTTLAIQPDYVDRSRIVG